MHWSEESLLSDTMIGTVYITYERESKNKKKHLSWSSQSCHWLRSSRSGRKKRECDNTGCLSLSVICPEVLDVLFRDLCGLWSLCGLCGAAVVLHADVHALVELGPSTLSQARAISNRPVTFDQSRKLMGTVTKVNFRHAHLLEQVRRKQDPHIKPIAVSFAQLLD